MAEVISARVGEDLLARVDDMRGEQTRGAWGASLIEGELTDGLAADPLSLPSLASAPVNRARASCALASAAGNGTPHASAFGSSRCARPAQPHSRAAPTGGRCHPARPASSTAARRDPDDPHTALRECRTRGAQNGIMEP